MVMRNSNELRSLILNRLITAKPAVLLMASVGRLRGILPNGVPKMVCAVAALRMKRTWSLVMGTTVQDSGLPSVSVAPLPQFWPMAVKLRSVLGLSEGLQGPPVAVGSKMAQASPA